MLLKLIKSGVSFFCFKTTFDGIVLFAVLLSNSTQENYSKLFHSECSTFSMQLLIQLLVKHM